MAQGFFFNLLRVLGYGANVAMVYTWRSKADFPEWLRHTEWVLGLEPKSLASEPFTKPEL